MLDRKAAELARGVGRVSLLLGECLSRLAEREGHHALGFSSFGAYVQERCGRTARWAQDTMRVARGAAEWPALWAAVSSGTVTWSAAEVVLRALAPLASGRAVLEPADASRAGEQWVERAQRLTVRELRKAVADARVAAAGQTAAEQTAAEQLAAEPDGPASVHRYLRSLPSHVLTLSVDTERAWWFDCARQIYERSVSDCGGGASSTQHFLTALLAEARVELEVSECGSDAAVLRWGAYVEQLAEWREESERRCDAQRRQLEPTQASEAELGEPAGGAASAVELDARVRALSTEVARRDIELGRLAGWLQRAEAWGRLGFSSESHYVRERMGVSYSQWKLWRHVARRLAAFPLLQDAVWRGELGMEAAGLLLRVLSVAQPLSAEPAHVELAHVEPAHVERAWVERARRRTFKHLREEVRAAELAAREGAPALPPSDDTLRRLQALEGRVKSGAALLSDSQSQSDSDTHSDTHNQSRLSVAGRSWLDLRCELREILGGAFLSGPGEPTARREPAAGRGPKVRLRLRLERDTLVEFRCLERLFHRRRRGDFLEFLCRHFLAVWAPAMLGEVKYGDVYRRDGFVCSSPVCQRRDLQPHHLRFRSAGGGEERDNLTSLCTWCHLEGVHGGRIRVAPPAHAMHWDLGRGFLQVHGRETLEE